MKTDLIGRSTSNELVTDVCLVLGTFLILGYDCDQRLQHTSQQEKHTWLYDLVCSWSSSNQPMMIAMCIKCGNTKRKVGDENLRTRENGGRFI